MSSEEAEGGTVKRRRREEDDAAAPRRLGCHADGPARLRARRGNSLEKSSAHQHVHRVRVTRAIVCSRV